MSPPSGQRENWTTAAAHLIVSVHHLEASAGLVLLHVAQGTLQTEDHIVSLLNHLHIQKHHCRNPTLNSEFSYYWDSKTGDKSFKCLSTGKFVSLHILQYHGVQFNNIKGLLNHDLYAFEKSHKKHKQVHIKINVLYSRVQCINWMFLNVFCVQNDTDRLKFKKKLLN